MAYRDYGPPTQLLIGYDPARDLQQKHLARLVEQVVEESIEPTFIPAGRGQPAFDPRLCAKVLIYGYATGIRSSRQLERHCHDSLSFLFLTRGDAPSYRTLCSFRVHHSDILKSVWAAMFTVAQEVGIERVGRITIDSTKIRADASPDAVVKQSEFDAMLVEFEAVLKEADQADRREEDQPPGSLVLDKHVEPEQMREIVRRVRRQLKGKEEPGATSKERKPLGPFMKPRLKLAIDAINEAKEQGIKHACLTDPDARMMGEGRQKSVRECHSFEVATDNGLLVAAQTSQSAHDACRLEPLVDAARQNEPEGVGAVDGDSGYYSGEMIASLIREGIDVCIPNSNTAGDLHRAQPIGTTRKKTSGSVTFEYHATDNTYTCPEGNVLEFRQQRQVGGQEVMVYRARNACTGCPLSDECGSSKVRKHRSLGVGVDFDLLHAHLERFTEPEHVERYRNRGHAVETVFGMLRAGLGCNRWMVRGKERVKAEARTIAAALQIRKIYCSWAG